MLTFTDAGESVVENLQVNLLESGVAVVGDKNRISESDIKGIEAPAGVSLNNGFASIERDAEEAFNKSVKEQNNGLQYDGQQQNLIEADGGGEASKGNKPRLLEVIIYILF